MREDEALFKAIVANPDEDTPRLAFADWLDENRPDRARSPASGPSARAEFIRVQCRLAATTPDDPDYVELLDREHDLKLWLDAHDPQKWKPPAGLDADDDDCQRGFQYQSAAEYGEGKKSAVKKLSAALQKGAGIGVTALRLYSYTGAQIAELLRNPAVAHLRTLFLQPSQSDDDDYFDLDEDDDDAVAATTSAETAEEVARALAESSHVQNLRELRLFFPITDAAAKILAGVKNLALTGLTVELQEASPDALRTLARAEWFRNLRKLRVMEELEDSVLLALSALPPMPNLRELDVSGNRFTPAAAARLAASKTFPNLLDLDIASTSLRSEGMAALAKAKWKLAKLNIRNCDLGNAGAIALAGSRLLSGVKVIDLGHNNIGPKGIKALAASRHAAALRHLGLEYNPLRKDGLMALAKSPHLRDLTRLELARYSEPPDYAAADVTAFLAALDMANLRLLALDGFPVLAGGARAIAKSASFARLAHLKLYDAKIGPGGLAALIASPHLSNLISADLNGNWLGKGAAALADRSVWPLLSECTLYDNDIPRALAKKLVRARRGISAHVD